MSGPIVTLLIICFSDFPLLSATSVAFRLLKHIPQDLLRCNVLPWLDFNSISAVGKTNWLVHQIVDDHLKIITARKYQECIEILNLTLDDFLHNFPPLKVQDTSELPMISRGMARHQLIITDYSRSQRKCKRTNTESQLTFELRDVDISSSDSSEESDGRLTDVRKYLVCKSENGKISSGCLMKYFLIDGRVKFTSSKGMERKQVIDLVKATFNGDAFRFGNQDHLTSVRNIKH